MAQRGWPPRYLDADLPIEQQIVVLEQELARITREVAVALYLDADLPIEQQIAAVEQELARIVELPSTPADLHDEFVQRLRQLRVRTRV
jgi:hypothetical protein